MFSLINRLFQYTFAFVIQESENVQKYNDSVCVKDNYKTK